MKQLQKMHWKFYHLLYASCLNFFMKGWITVEHKSVSKHLGSEPSSYFHTEIGGFDILSRTLQCSCPNVNVPLRPIINIAISRSCCAFCNVLQLFWQTTWTLVVRCNSYFLKIFSKVLVRTAFHTHCLSSASYAISLCLSRPVTCEAGV
jgi:hypothetical protein